MIAAALIAVTAVAVWLVVMSALALVRSYIERQDAPKTTVTAADATAPTTVKIGSPITAASPTPEYDACLHAVIEHRHARLRQRLPVVDLEHGGCAPVEVHVSSLIERQMRHRSDEVWPAIVEANRIGCGVGYDWFVDRRLKGPEFRIVEPKWS